MSSALGCGYKRQSGAKDCKEIGYITFRGALVGVVRQKSAQAFMWFATAMACSSILEVNPPFFA